MVSPPILICLVVVVMAYGVLGYFTALLVASPPAPGGALPTWQAGPRIMTLLGIFWPLAWAGAIVCAVLWFFWKACRAVVYNEGWSE